MRLGFSNLIENSLSSLQLQELHSFSDCIDWAPSLTNPKWDLIDEKGKARITTPVPISAIQSLFFGIKGLHFMRSDAEFQVMLNHLQFLSKVADIYNAPFVLWGAPGTRNVDMSEVSDELIVRRLGTIYSLFANSTASFLIEAVSAKFGCKFINSSRHLVAMMERFPTYKLDLHLDTGQMIDEGLDVLDFIESNISSLKHIHLSEPDFSYTGKYNGLLTDVVDLLTDKSFRGDIVLEVQNVEPSKINQLTLFFCSLKSK